MRWPKKKLNKCWNVAIISSYFSNLLIIFWGHKFSHAFINCSCINSCAEISAVICLAFLARLCVPSWPTLSLLCWPSQFFFFFLGAMKILLGSPAAAFQIFIHANSLTYLLLVLALLLLLLLLLELLRDSDAMALWMQRLHSGDRRQKECCVRICIVHYVYATASGYVKWLGLHLVFCDCVFFFIFLSAKTVEESERE